MRAVAVLLAALAAAGPLLAGTALSLQLPANPSTGYRWVVNEAQSSGLDLVALAPRGYGPPESDRIGAPAPALWDLACTGRGAVRLVFDYVSPDGGTVGETRALEIDCP